jgi:hypothetical protein
MPGNFWKAALSAGLSICGSSAIAPLVVASRVKKYSRLSSSTYWVFLNAAPFRIFLKPPIVCFTWCMLLDMMKVPIAAPPIVSSSNGMASMSGSTLPPAMT